MPKESLPDATFSSGIGPSGVKGTTRIISIDGSGAKVPGSEKPAPQPPKPEPHVEKAAEEQAEPAATATVASPESEAPKTPQDVKTEPTPTTDTPPTETKPAETAVEPPKAPEQKPTEPATDFMKLSRRERSFFQREKDLQAKEAKVSKILAAIEAKDEEKVLEALGEHGITYDGITKKLIGKKEPDKADALVERLEKVEKKLSAEEEAEQRQNYLGIRKLVTENAKKLAAENKQKFELVHAMGDVGGDLVYEILEEYTLKTGKQLTYDEALTEAEKYYDGLAKSLSEAERFKRSAAPSVPGNGSQPQSSDAASGKPVTPPTKTLTNAQAAAAPHAQSRKLSREESVAEAAKLLRWTN